MITLFLFFMVGIVFSLPSSMSMTRSAGCPTDRDRYGPDNRDANRMLIRMEYDIADCGPDSIYGSEKANSASPQLWRE